MNGLTLFLCLMRIWTSIQIPHTILLLSLESTSSTGIEIKAANHYAILPYTHANWANSSLKIYKYYLYVAPISDCYLLIYKKIFLRDLSNFIGSRIFSFPALPPWLYNLRHSRFSKRIPIYAPLPPQKLQIILILLLQQISAQCSYSPQLDERDRSIAIQGDPDCGWRLM